MKPLKIVAREILDSRGNPTIEVELCTKNGISRASVPAGASKGIYEATELRDGEKRYLGLGVKKAVSNVNKTISKAILKKDFKEQRDVDELLIKLDRTENKSRIGANALLAVSMASCRAFALEKRISLYEQIAGILNVKKFVLPVPAMNIINGGKHAGNNIDFQEFMIIPVGAKSFNEALRMGSETYHILKEIIIRKHGKSASNVGDEGGFAPPLDNVEEPLKLISEAIDEAGYGGKIKLGIDCASSEFYRNGKYYLEGTEYDGTQLLEKYKELAERYPIISIEDPFAQDDFDNFVIATKTLGDKIQIVGDDLLVTNPKRIQKAIVLNACNALLLKINQIGTVSEALEAAALCFKSKWSVMVSHRSGETEDTFISDLAVGIASGQIKSGAPCRGERTAKYNQLLRIEEGLGKRARFHKWGIDF